MSTLPTVRSLERRDIARCEEILRSLPDWFGIEESNRAYIESLSDHPSAVACVNGRVGGFIALTEHNPHSVEIHVMAVDPRLHHNGIGSALVEWAEDWCEARSSRWLHVKTRGPSTPEP